MAHLWGARHKSEPVSQTHQACMMLRLLGIAERRLEQICSAVQFDMHGSSTQATCLPLKGKPRPSAGTCCRQTDVTGCCHTGKIVAAGRAQTFPDLHTALEEYSRTGDMSVLQGLSNFMGSPEQVCPTSQMACPCKFRHTTAGHCICLYAVLLCACRCVQC